MAVRCNGELGGRLRLRGHEHDDASDLPWRTGCAGASWVACGLCRRTTLADAAGVVGMTFDELFKDYNLTPDERAALVAYLASLRMMATLRALMTPNT